MVRLTSFLTAYTLAAAVFAQGEPTLTDRLIALEGASNLRDLGGYGANGGVLRRKRSMA